MAFYVYTIIYSIIIIIIQTGEDYKFTFYLVFKSRLLILCQPIKADDSNDDGNADGVKSILYKICLI